MTDTDYATSTQGEGRCPHCGEGPLKAWYELSEDEREMAQRLPAAPYFTQSERAARHLFCTRCWHEETSPPPLTA